MTDNRAPDETGDRRDRPQDGATAPIGSGRRRLLQGVGAGAFVTVLASRPAFAQATDGSHSSAAHSGPLQEEVTGETAPQNTDKTVGNQRAAERSGHGVKTGNGNTGTQSADSNDGFVWDPNQS